MRKLIVILFAALLAAPSYGAIAYNAGATADCNSTDVNTCDFSSYTAVAGGVSIVGLRISTNGDILTVVSDGVNTYSLICTSIDTGAIRTYWYKAENTAGGAVTLNFQTSSSLRLWGVLAHYTGVPTGSVLESDIECGENESAASPQTTGTVTTTDTNRQIVCGISLTGPITTIAPNSSETERQETGGGGTARMQIQDKAAASAAGYTCSWALTGSQAASYMAIALQPSVAGGSSSKPLDGPLGGPLVGPL